MGSRRSGRTALLAALLALLVPACGSKASTDTSGAGGSQQQLPPCVTPAGATTTLYQGLVTGLASRGAQVYIADRDRIVSVPVAGGAPAVVAVPGDVYGLALLGDSAYYTGSQLGPVDPQGKQSADSTLDSVPLAGGTPTTLLSPPPPTSEGLMVAGGASLYFGGPIPGSLNSVGKLTPPGASLVDLPLDGTVFPYSIALHGDYLYVAAADITNNGFDNGVVERVPVSGGAATTLLSGIGHPTAIAVDDSGLYLAVDPLGFTGSGTVVRAHVDGSSMTTLLESGATSLALAGGRVYVATGDGIVSVSIDGGAPQQIAQGGKSTGMLRVVGGNLVWLDPVSKALSDNTVPVVQTACLQ
jgi:hypothetical protein